MNAPAIKAARDRRHLLLLELARRMPRGGGGYAFGAQAVDDELLLAVYGITLSALHGKPRKAAKDRLRGDLDRLVRDKALTDLGRGSYGLK